MLAHIQYINKKIALVGSEKLREDFLSKMNYFYPGIFINVITSRIKN